jgi:ACT domain-containing protein
LGYTQLKDEEILNESIRKNLNINNETLKNSKKSAIATFYALGTKYLKIKESLSPDVKMTEDELAQLAIISWNEPVDKVIETANKYKSLDKVRKAYQDSYGYDDKNKTLFPYDLALDAFNLYIK